MLGLFMYKRRENEFMKKRMIRFCCGVMAAGLLLSGIPVPAMSGNMQKVAVSVLAEDAVIVTDYDEFANALSSGKKNISSCFQMTPSVIALFLTNLEFSIITCLLMTVKY